MTKTINTLHPCANWPRLLLISSLVPFLAFAAAGRGQVDVEFENSLVTISAYDAPVVDVLQQIAAKGDLRIVQHVMLTGAVSLQLEAVPLSTALDQILINESYQLYQGVADGPVPGTLWIFADGAEAVSAAGVFFEAVILYGTIAEKKEAIRELRRLGTADGVAILSLALGDGDARVRKAAIEALSSIGSDDALAAVASATADADPWLRGQAVNALSAGDSESAMQYLRLAFTDPDPNVRLAVIEAFADNPNNQSVTMLSVALRDEDPMVRMYAVDALEEIGGEVAFEALLNASDDGFAAVDEQEDVNESLSSLTRRP
ncbi:MAG: HEAT repeat domain-containing protein [Woeseiaceae bacterium]